MTESDVLFINASEDLATAQFLYSIYASDNNRVGSLVRASFFLQQCCEKFLKFHLTNSGITHSQGSNIVYYFKLCELNSVEVDLPICKSNATSLNKWYEDYTGITEYKPDADTVCEVLSELKICLKFDSSVH